MPRAVDLVPHGFKVDYDPTNELAVDPALKKQIDALGDILGKAIPKQFQEQFQRLIDTLLGIATDPIGELVDWVHNVGASAEVLRNLIDQLINGGQPINVLNLFGQILPTQISQVSISSIVGELESELLTNPKFDGAISMSGQGLWSWDATAGKSSPGSAKTDADGIEKELLSNYIPVGARQQLRGSVWTQWQGMAASGDAIKLEYAMFEAGAPRGTLPLAKITGPAANSSWTQLTGTTTVPPDMNIDSVRLRLSVSNTCTAGTVWFDDASASKFGLLPQEFVAGLTAIISLFKSLFDAVGGVVNTGILDIQSRLAALGLDGKFDASQLGNIGNSVIQTLKDTIGGTVGATFIDVQNRLSGLNNLGQLAVNKLLGQLPHGQVTSPVGGASLGGDFGKIIDGFWNVVFGTTASGKNTDDFATATAALKQTADDAKAAAIYASDLINLPRRSPRWLSTGTHDDVSFPIINASSTFTPPLGKLVLIPITPDVARVYKSVKVGITTNTMTQLFIGLFRIDSGGYIVLDTNLGNQKSSVTASKVQTFAIPDPFFAVDRGETVFIGALQVGGTAAPILTNNAMLSVLESVQPVPLFFTQDGGASLTSLPSSVGTSVELNPAWGALGEVLIESQWTDFNYTGGPSYSGQWFTYTIPSTSRYLYLVGLGAGGAGGGGDGGAGYSGEGGRAGQWVAKRIERGVDIDWGVTTLSVLVTNGGIYTEKETAGGPGGGSNRTYNWYHTTTTSGFPRYASGVALGRNDAQLYYANSTTPPTGTPALLLAPSGDGGRGSWFNGAFTPDGQSPGNFAFGGRLFIGAPAIPGTPSGVGADSAGVGGGGQGGHGGSGGNGTRGGAGSPGLVAIRAV
ncbi:Bacteriophage protein [Mycobacteroides abscessus subsp. massiliense]|uniref:glycine-rich domain-containing protein n=1 Tax=Mycobacteroides abscessus TaxID=36809 RepID=UPI0009A5645C|nr:hypothetical protein [Mycobacteroides abscessus]SKM80889.1 Bacteriophage protein [Mycobacteroides abscessus subsp. massiliense]SKM97203.1 Bacteriophage protein [Mycobacteroides abscessus subsp. massiliense]SKN76113.1 Bacteriophage protein [Mycobacteroides abscessus subsp. massiliense]SKN97031.1 Bacteriophage protein [Mycobacteroides abscessus subsp. massiliense]SKO20799.1 Bacteriophage protein [Mycobacteroides abscessus subsp. massiliense]